MKKHESLNYTAFEGSDLLISGRLDEVAIKVRRRFKAGSPSPILIFSDMTGKEMDLDLRGTEAEMMDRLKVFISTVGAGTPSTGPGRPKLGVIAREVSLLPRHWEWLSTQQGGASSTLRRLIEEARNNPSSKELAREAQERTHKFMTAMAGNLPDYEEALRALYAKDKKAFQGRIHSWPKDVREHAKKLAGPAW
jgi:hypothetical protein